MNAVEKPSFESTTHERIYEFVEQEGAVSMAELRDRTPFDADVADLVAELVSDGYLIDVAEAVELGLGAETGSVVEAGDTTATIRIGRQRELPALVETIRRVVADVHCPSADALVDRLEREGVLKRHNEAGTRMVFVATVDERIVGWVHLGASATQRVHRTAELTLGVRSEHRRLGVGTRLLRRGHEWCVASQFRNVRQRIARSNDAALTFLEGHGWEAETIRRNQYAHDGERIDEVVMGRRLDSA